MATTSELSRKERIKLALEAFKNRNDTRFSRIEYRGAEKYIEIIRMNPNDLLLNHDNSRLRAQLFDHPDEKFVQENPTAARSQEILADLLRQTNDFKTLKLDLKTQKQQQPGLISRDGLLINGNTRVVALRDLGEEGVDVAVLPEDADTSVFLDLEMTLQMQHLTHQEYTFTNQLLLIEKYKKYGNTNEQLIKKMGWIRYKNKKLTESMQLLQLVNEIRKLRNPPLSYTLLDKKEQHLRDLNDEYQKLLIHDSAAADSMKWNRVIAIFLNLNKDETRTIDDIFISEEVSFTSETLSEGVKNLINTYKKMEIIDGLDGIVDQEINPDKLDARRLAERVVSEITDDDGSLKTELTPQLQELKKIMWQGARNIIRSNQNKNNLLQPGDLLRDSLEALQEVSLKFNEVCDMEGFNHSHVKYELNKVDALIKKIKEDFNKRFP